MTTDKNMPKSFDELTIETSYSSMYGPFSGELTTFSGSFERRDSIVSSLSRSDGTRASSRSSRSSRSSLFSEPIYPIIKNSYHRIHRPSKYEDSTAQLSSHESFERYDHRDNSYLSRRSVTPKRDSPRCTAPRSLTPHICDRLYSMGVHTQRVKAKQERIRRKTAEEEEEKKLQTVPLRRNRSYTPMKPRPYDIADEKKYNSVHDYLFDNAKERQIEKKLVEKEQAEKGEEILLSPREKDEVVGRLYSRSSMKQYDGKQRRRKIAIAHAPKPTPPQKKISIENATALYDRLMAQKRHNDRKITAARIAHTKPFKARNIGAIN